MDTNSFLVIVEYVALELASRTKVHQKADFDLRGPEIIQHLSFPGRFKSTRRLVLLELKAARAIQHLSFPGRLKSPRRLELQEHSAVHDEVCFVISYLPPAKPNGN